MFQLIHLSFCKTIHGEFSKEYFFLAQKYKEKNPNLNVTLKKCFSTEAILKFENLIVRNSSFTVYKTQKSILMDKIVFGSDIKDIVRQRGASSCVNYFQVEDDTIKIIGYKEYILDLSATLLFCFCNGKYIMGEYFFSSSHRTVTNQLAKTILKRYNTGVESEVLQFYVEDEKGSILCFYDNGFSLSIKYFNPSTYHLVENLLPIFQQKTPGNQNEIPVPQDDHALKNRL